ncbi:MAG: dTMP kinase [Gammaproteobacteria bacterium]
MKNKFISLEGIEGAGKSTALSFIEDYLTRSGCDVVVTREPGGTEIAEKIRDVLLDHYDETMAYKTEALLMCASRAQHVIEKIKPALTSGKWVLSDRFADASIAYQGGGRQLGVEKVAILQQWAIDEFNPDLTILLDLPVETGMKRMKQRQALDRIESETVDFFQRIRDAYLELSKRYPERYRVVDASEDIEGVQVQLKTILDEVVS